MSVYDGLETSSWLGQNPAVTESLNRLKQLEELRKQRELQTREKLASIRSTRNYGNLRKSSLTDAETGSRFLRRSQSSSDEESTIPACRSVNIANHLGGARPKFSSSISREETNKGGEHDQWFSGVAESILGPSFTSRNLSPRKSIHNDGHIFYEDANRISRTGSLSRDHLSRSSFQGTLGQLGTRAAKGSDNLFDGVLESAFSEGIIAPKISNLRRNFDDAQSDFQKHRGFASSKINNNRVLTNCNNVNQREYGRQESQNDDSLNGQYIISEESHIEESQHQEGENKTNMEEEEEEEEHFDDPVEFSQSLKNFRSSNEVHGHNFTHIDNSGHKRTAHSGLLVGSVPIVPPLKKVKSIDLNDVNSDQCSVLPDVIHTYEDLTSVAKDIVDTFSHPLSPDGLGPRSPSYKEHVEATQIRSGYDFSKSQQEFLDENGHLKVPDFSVASLDDQKDNLDSDKAIFTSQNHTNIVRRTSSNKKKKRPPSFHRKGESEQISDSENNMEKKTLIAVNGRDMQDSSATGSEQFTIRLTGLSGPDVPLVCVDTVKENQKNGNKDGRVEHLGILNVTDSLYRSGSSEWVVINQDDQIDDKTVMESKKVVQENGGESDQVESDPNEENKKSIVSSSGLRRKLCSTSSQPHSSVVSQALSPSTPEKKGLIARWKNMFGSFSHPDVVTEFDISKDTLHFGDETGTADQSIQPGLTGERKVCTDKNVSNDITKSDDFQSAESSPRSDSGLPGRSSVANAIMSDSDEAFETASDDSSNRDRQAKAKDEKSKMSRVSSLSRVKDNFGNKSEATEQSENTIAQNGTGLQQTDLLQSQDHYKSPGDILGNLREIRRFVHKSVSDSSTSEDLSAQLNRTDTRKLMVDAQTMTDASLRYEIVQQHGPKLISTCVQTEFEVILKDSEHIDDKELNQCPHCGKMSSICITPEIQERKDNIAGKNRGYMRGTASCHVKNNIRKSVSNPLKNSEKDSNKPPIPNVKSSPTPQRDKRRPSFSKNDSDGCSSKMRPSTPVSSTPSYMRSTSATRLKEIDKSEQDLRIKRSPSRASSLCDGEELGQMSHMNKKQSKSLNQLEFSNQDYQILKKLDVVPKQKSPENEMADDDPNFLGNVSSLTEATTALIEKAFQDSKMDQNHRPDQYESLAASKTINQNSNLEPCANHTDSVALSRSKLEKADSVHVTDGKGSSNFKNYGKPKLSGIRQLEITAQKKSNKPGKCSTPDFQHARSPVKKPAEFKEYNKVADSSNVDAKDVDSTCQFTTIVDNPFIKNDSQCREGLKMKAGPGPNKSVWTKSVAANQEKEKITHNADLKSIESGSKNVIETCDASVKEESVKIANQDVEQNIFCKGGDLSNDKNLEATLCSTISVGKEDNQKMLSSSSISCGVEADSKIATSTSNTSSEDDSVHSVQNVNVTHQVSQVQTHPRKSHTHEAGMAGIQRFNVPNAIVVETDVDAAFEEYKTLKSGSGNNVDGTSSGRLENGDHVAFAEKACSKLLDLDTFVDVDKLEKNLQQNEELDFPDTVIKELQHSPRQSISSESSSNVDGSSMTSEYSTDASSVGPTSPIDPCNRKQHKKSKSKKGFFKGILSNSTRQNARPKESSSTSTPESSSPLPSHERNVALQYPVETPVSVILSKTADEGASKHTLELTSLNAVPLQENVAAVISNASETQNSAPTQKGEERPTTPQVIGHHGNEVKVSNQDVDSQEEEFQARINLKNWDPSELLQELYKVTLMPDDIEDISYKFVTMEGLMEKLPMNKKKATLLKTWKRRFFKATGGWLHYYETSNRDKPSDSIQLMGGKIENLGNRVIGVDDGRGRFLMVRAPSDREHGQWILAMESQTADNVKATYVRPALTTPPHNSKRVLILDIGSSGIRAGILGESPCLPTLFFPSVVAEDNQTKELFIGMDSFKPEVRHKSILKYPVLPTNKVDKFNIDMEVMPKIFAKVLKELSLNPKTTWVMLGTPQNLGDKLKEGLMKILVDEFHTKGVCMVQQSLLALYSYRTDSGIIVDIGNRMEILPIYEGVLIEGGVSRQVCGGQKVADSLLISLLENKYKFSTLVEKLIVRYIMEKSCYVVENYSEAKKKCDADPGHFRTTVSLSNFDLPEGAHMSVTHDYSCFKSAEGLFNTDLWGLDYPSIQKLVFQAIQACPMDSRKHMYRSIYLSGGVTMLPGFAERLQTELKKLAPPSVVVEVHASPQRYHSAYIGACALAGMDVFEKSCISAEEWKQMGTKAFKKWSTNSSS